MTDQEKEAEAQLRSSIEDTLAILKVLKLHCDNVSQVLSILELALTNDGQLRFLWSKLVKT